MPDRIAVAHGTEDEWAQETSPLALAELGFATDSLTLKIGDGNTLWSGLVGVVIGGRTSGAAVIDDSSAADGTGRGDAALSSLLILQLINAKSIADRKYADGVAAQAGGPRVVPVIQNPDGSWPSSTAGPSDISLYQGTVGFGAAPPAGPYDITALKDPA